MATDTFMAITEEPILVVGVEVVVKHVPSKGGGGPKLQKMSIFRCILGTLMPYFLKYTIL
jgi:hypothetical protein